MLYASHSDIPMVITGCGDEAVKTFWGAMPLPKNSKAIGVYSDKNRVGVYIEFDNGNAVVGNCGCVSRCMNSIELFTAYHAEYALLK